MRTFYTIFVGFCLSNCLTAQSPFFYAYGNISAVTSTGSGNYNVTITGFNGGYKQWPDANYETSEVPATPTDFVVWASCTRFAVVARTTTVPFGLLLSDVGGALASGDLNGSRIAIIQESRFGVYNLGAVANVSDGNAGMQVGISPYEHGCMQNYYRDQLQQAISGFSVFTSARLTGNGTSGAPLDIAQQGATTGQILKWNGTQWAPATDNTGGGATIDSVMVKAGTNGLSTKVNNTSSTEVPIPPNALSSGGATPGQVLRWNGADYAPATVDADWEEEYFGSVTGTSISATGTLPTINTAKRVVLYRTGVKMAQGVDYTISGNNFMLTVAAQAESFTVRYK